MASKRTKNPARGTQPEEEWQDSLPDVASATECTGLTPSLPVTEAETASYREIADLPLTQKRRRKPYDRDPSRQ